MKPIVKTIANQRSWIMRSRDVELAVTQTGGHMAPVTFYRQSRRPVQPYYINPWHGEGMKITEPVLVPLRGDFFCLPFGAPGRCRGKEYQTHGEPAGAKWKLLELSKDGPTTAMTLSIKTKAPAGKVTKRLQLLDGETVVYVQHVLEGFSGAFPCGHHATLAVPEKPGSVQIALSPFRWAMTNPTQVGDPAAREYQSLAINKRFKDLEHAPLIWRDPPTGDYTSFPVRKGFTDLLACFNKPGSGPAWTTATVGKEGYLWFSLKDPRVLPTTMLWLADGGRHGEPWNGRNRCLGLEEICSFFAEGLGLSTRPNVLSKAGIPTAIKLSPRKTTTINYIEGVIKVPRGFKKVKQVLLSGGRATFISTTGKKVAAAVQHEFLRSGKLG